MEIESEVGGIRRACARSRRFGWWIASGLGLVVGYLFGIPMLLFLIDANTLSEVPSFLDFILEICVAPLEWIYDHSELYQDFIGWEEGLFEP